MLVEETESMQKNNRGKQYNQKIKPLLVWYYLSRNTDENHYVTARDIVDYLQDNGIYAERRSIYSDIEQINKIVYMMETDCTLGEAEIDLEDDPECAPVQLIPKRGYYIKHQNYDVDLVRLLFESVYSARFVDSSQMEELTRILRSLVSDYQADSFNHEVLNVDYSRTQNKDTFYFVGIINDAMSAKLEGVQHMPEQISFKYMSYSINDMKQSVARRGGESYVVSPYKLIISDGNYYLHAFDHRNQKMQTFRVDRMKSVKRLGIPREGKEIASKEDYKTYSRRVFSMYGGDNEIVKLRFDNSLLNTVVDRFGNDQAKYGNVDGDSFTIIADIEISPQFYGWLCGLGKKVEVIEPRRVREEYYKYIKDISSMYQEDEK